jgi:hypothetical protein
LRKAELIKFITSEHDASVFSDLPFCSTGENFYKDQNNNNSSNLLSKIASTNNMSKIESNDNTIKIPNLKKKRRRFSCGGNNKDVFDLEKIEKKYTKNDYSIITEDNTLLSVNTQNGGRNEKKQGKQRVNNYLHFAEYMNNVKKKSDEYSNTSFYVPGFDAPYGYFYNGYGNYNNYVFPSVPNFNYMYFDPSAGKLNYGSPGTPIPFSNCNNNNMFVQPKDRVQE